jgi:hypothetical protein
MASHRHGFEAKSWALWALLTAGAAALALRVAAVFTVAGNWDEFGLFEAASRTAESGVLVSGGRPGLAQLLVLPLVQACTGEMEVLQSARLGWVLFTVAYLLGVGVLIAQLQPDPQRKLGDALLGVGLLALVPAFLEWSVQVRTDQFAIAGGAWGGVALLASRRRSGLALLAGLLFGVGFLSSQKLLYVAGAVGLLALGQLWIAREWNWKRELLRGAFCAATFVAALGLFRFVVAAQQVDISANTAAAAATGVSKQVVAGGLFAFDFYRKTIGWSQYIDLAPTLAPHALLFVALVAATFVAVRAGDRAARSLAVAWAVLALGLAVGLFHAAAFAYFWMTLGVFPALALATARGPMLNLLPASGPVRTAACVGFWLLLALPGVATMLALLEDTQSVQRESFAFVQQNFDVSAPGFHPESGLFCRGDGQPIRHYYSRDIYMNFGRDGTEANRQKLIAKFHDEQIQFVLHSFRLNQFPVEVRRFWSDNYQPYRASVFVAGRRLAAGAGHGLELDFELVAPGEYRWLPRDGPRAIAIDGRPIAAGDVLRLEAGPHHARFPRPDSDGMLVLAMQEPPGTAPLSFYKDY